MRYLRSACSPSALAIDISVDNKICPVEQAVVAKLSTLFLETERFMLERMRDVTLRELAERGQPSYDGLLQP